MSGILQTLFLGAVATVKDAYFNLVTLLLNTTSTNGAQNNTFLDSSSNNFTITRNGNTTQGTFSPFSQTGWSNYFNGSSDYLNYATGQNIANFGTGDFTIEAWVNPSIVPIGATSGFQIITSPQNGSNITFYFQFYNSQLQFGVQGFAALIAQSWVPTVGQWVHVAVCRSGTNLRAFINGTQLGTTVTNSSNFVDGVVQIAYGGAGYLNGYVSNIRINKSAIYTANFTPSTTPLTADANTVLLTAQSNRFVDNASKTLTLGGTPSVQAFSPFAPTTAYSTSTVGGSGYFDGSGDYLTVANNTALNLAGTSWTIECWYYPTALGGSAYRSLMCKRQNLSGEWDFGLNQSDNVYFWNGTGYSSSTKPILNAWNHMAATHDGTSLRMYLNGALVYGPTSVTITNTTDSVGIGAVPGGGQPMTGYLASSRVTKGGALYTGSTYTVPAAPFTTTVSSGTANLLLNYTNAGIYDAAAKNDLETVGNAQVSTTQAKFGTTSMYFDGTGDYLSTPTNSAFLFNTGDFTVELWYYPLALTGTPGNSQSLVGMWGPNSSNASWLFYLNSGNLYWYTSTNGSTQTATMNAASGMSINNWYHLALCRNNGTTRIFVNGTSIVSTTTSVNLFNATCPLIVGYNPIGGTPDYVYGYIDELRITKGYARYTANFTPPAAAFPVQ